MAGKRGLIMGVANDRSIAWGIARAAAAEGAELAFTYQGEALRSGCGRWPTGGRQPSSCPATSPTKRASTRSSPPLAPIGASLDFVVHAIAFSDKDELKGRYVDTTRKNFAMTMDISCFSFTAVCQRAEPMMPNGGSLLTLTYYGAERVMPHYNVMGVAKAALEASVRYLAADLGGRASASTRSPPGRSRRWPPRASAISATSCAGTS